VVDRHCSVYLRSTMSSVEFTPSKRGFIIQLKELSYTYDQICTKLGVSKSGAWWTIQCDKIHNTRNTLSRSGHPEAVNDRKRHQVLRKVCGNHCATFVDIAENLYGITACQIQTIAAEHGLHHHVAHRKPFLSAANVKKQLAWAKANEWKDWDKVIWTDEAKIELGECPGHQYVTHGPGEEFLPKNIQPTFHSGRDSIMVWGCISRDQKGPLIRLKMQPGVIDKNGKKQGGGLNGPKYVEQVLCGPLVEFVADMKERKGDRITMVEDGAPSHRSVVAKKA
jgi:hypothetical protein